ncbi:MAG TPA: hypothetical protein VGN97_02215 [Mesorhizobium sp.]|jgi:hypothetical protein|nr:hypothetical protein [Mesorhizobium sp.]
MARKPVLNIDALTALGPEKLARLVLDEAGRSAPFRKVVNAALAGAKGPEAVAKQIDRRLSALERARSFVDWQKERAFRHDLEATLRTILDELGRASPELAIDRLLRFVATHRTVFERIDDSSGRIQSVYRVAAEGLAGLVSAIREEDRRFLPQRLQPLLRDDSHGLGTAMALSIVPLLPAGVLAAWDNELAREHGQADKSSTADTWDQAITKWAALDLRQAIADVRGDLDAFIALERTKPPRRQNCTDIAERLLAAGRPTEALDWVRQEGKRAIADTGHAPLARGALEPDLGSSERLLLEARILDALGRKTDAQALRWQLFEASLDAKALRAFVERLGDFEEFEVLDRAFAHVMGSKHRYRSLHFLLTWPRLDLAAEHVIVHASDWDGRHYDLLAPAAEALEGKHPLAATILYRTLLADILNRAKSQAYGHGARYLERLEALAKRVASDLTKAGLAEHQAYRTALHSAHGRKTAFWSSVEGGTRRFLT